MFFLNHCFGLLILNCSTVAVHCKKEDDTITYWLFDSHARGPKGCRAVRNGTSSCMKFKTIEGLYDILRRNLIVKNRKSTTSNSAAMMVNVYSLTPLIIAHENIPHRRQENIESSTTVRDIHENIPALSPGQRNRCSDTKVIFETSMLHSIDETIPILDSVISTNTSNLEPDVKLAEITRKTTCPLSLERERRMEELSWYFLFPDGKHGFGEKRDIPITPLDYFQARVMGSEKRFRRNDYLFFALSVVEYFRAKSSVSVSCRMRQGQQEKTPQGLIDNIHLTMRNVRGSAAYWRRCCAELIAMIRSLGPPTWFLTFSCNDLNWPDMLRALLIADERRNTDPSDLTFPEKLNLVQKYPIIIARQFSLRVNTLIKYMKNNPDCLGGPVLDFWYRIEFQNRGSPHLHMLVWCENIPDFCSTAGISVIDRIVSCAISPDSESLQQIVRNVQIHKHTNTCYKDKSDRTCRFGFPRPASETTFCLGAEESLLNSGRFCVLRRSLNEALVNNYNPTLLSLWDGNMDIQPCGNVAAVSYYIAKYASKCEPHDSGTLIKEAVLKAKRTGGTVWKQLFAVSMAILSQRLVSAAECAYRLCHLPLKMCSRKTVFVNSCLPNQRFRLLRFEEDETSIYNNIFDRYVQRPDELEQLSLAEFAVRFECISNTLWNEDNCDIELREVVSEPSRYIRLRDNSRMRIRNRPAVLRTRYYTLNGDKEGYYYSMIVCHIPFRDESELLLEGESAESCFLRRKNDFRPLHNLSTEQFAYAEQIIQQALAQAAALDAARNLNVASRNIEQTICADEQIFLEPDLLYEEEEENAAVPDNVFFENMNCLNVQQKDLFKKISNAIENDLKNHDEKFLLFITGGAGSGKSFILKFLVEHIRRCYAPTVDILIKPKFVEVASLTGVAARQVFGKTLHSVFSLPIEKGKSANYRKLSGQKLEQERRKWRYINWLVIDEVSMVSYEIMRMIHLRLQEFKSNDKLFGGVNILLFGDIMQLPPVKGHWCFQQPPWCAAEINLWHQFSFCELTINMRQKNDLEFVDLLNNLRFGELTMSQLELLYERRRVPLTGEFKDGVVVHIYPTVKQVDSYNHEMTSMNSKMHHMYVLCAIDESREVATYGKTPPDNVIPSEVNSCGGLLQKIMLGVESRVMLRRNISVSDGLVNGAMGIVKKFKWPSLRRDQLEEGELPEAVFVKFDDSTIGVKIKDGDDCVAVPVVSATFQGKKGYGDIERRMLPLILSWAVTVHKLQGTTLDKAVIDIGKNIFAKGQAYVALSRVRTLDGIALCDLEPSKLLRRPHDERALAEMIRLRSLLFNQQ